MVEKFGKTWWGQHWLKSLANVDDENRLPRGASYARSGHVKSVAIEGNQIAARVQGSRPSPYKVSLVVPKFSEKEVARLMEKIIEHPALISKLLNRELDPEILNIAEHLGLKVFPSKWSDFKMECSCPDWAVPCKHLASVIYLISREIDNNPFLVFNLHTVDLIGELKKREIIIDDLRESEIAQLKEILKPAKSRSTPTDNVASPAAPPPALDFSTLQPVSDALVQLLTESPPFYPQSNFREKYAHQLGLVTKNATRILTKNVDIKTFFRSDAKREIAHRTTFFFAIDTNNGVEVLGENHNFKNLEDIIPALFALNPDRLSDYEPSVEILHTLLLAAMHFTANGAIIPQIVRKEDGNFIIRWLPASIDNRVQTIVEKLQTCLTEDLLFAKTTDRQAKNSPPLENQVDVLLSLFIGWLVFHFSRPSDELFEAFFFKKHKNKFDGIVENALSGGINAWLARYYLSAGQYKPVIAVSEGGEDEFDVEVSVEDTSRPEQISVPLKSILQQKQYEKTRFKILQSVSLLTPFVRGLDTHINLGGEAAIRFGGNEFAPFLINVLPAIRLLGIKILLPKSLQELLRPKVSVRLKQKSEASGFLRLDDLLDFDWQVALGDQVVSPEEFDKLFRNASKLLKFKEKFIYVDDTDLEKIHKSLLAPRPLNPFDLLQTALAEEYEGATVALTDDVKKLIKEFTTTENVTLPQGLNATLRPYQERGFSWMYRNSKIGFGSIIADDMGLGKTLQVICILLKLKEESAINEKQKALVIVPTGLLTNWQAEIAKFAPSLSTHIYHGTNRDITNFDADILLATYGVLRSDHEILKKLKWQLMIIDEAQNIKNQDTAQAKAIKSIHANIKIAMSGTPVENRLTEFWSIMDFVNKGYLGNIKTFRENFAKPIQVFSDENAATRFRKITAPFMMRRMKSDKSIISDLPDKVEQNQFAVLTKQQAALYQKTMQAAMKNIEEIEDTDSQSLFKRQGLVLQMILALKQICNHPTQFLKDKKFDATLSGKCELLFDLLESITESGEKVLLFTQFAEMGELLERFIAERFGEQPMFYHGGCSVKQREEMVQRFQHNRADKIFILSLKAAGTGLNLTAASHVIHYDLWWNPAVENQATDRAYRIGQTKNVMVHRMICKNTFEEKIDAMIQQKKHLAEMTVASGENWIGKLSNKELREIFE